MKKINMVDLKGQYDKIKEEIDQAILKVVESTAFITDRSKEFSTGFRKISQRKT